LIDIVRSVRQAFQDGVRYKDIRHLVLLYLSSPIPSIDCRWHPLGFIDIPLTQRSSLTKLSIHVWHPRFSKAQKPYQICHSHGWHLSSIVLTGSLQNEIFEVQDNPRGHARIHEIGYHGSTSYSSATSRRVTAAIAETEQYSIGDTYTLPSDQYHWTSTPNSLLVTLMCSDLTHETQSYVVWPWSQQSVYRYDRETCSPDVKREIISDVIAEIGDS